MRIVKERIASRLNENVIFLLIVGFVFLFGMLTLIKTERKSSVSENRTLAKFEHFTVDKFIDGTFQSNFENALSDQFPKSETIKVVYGNMMNKLPDFGMGQAVCSGRYVTVPGSTDNNRVTFNCDDYIMYRASTMDESQKKIFKQNVAKYNHVNGLVDTYYYFINDATTYDFSKGEKTVDYKMLLEERLKGKYHLATFEYDGYDEFKKYFYKTDHHWNYVGSYRGYVEIAKMLGIKDVASPVEVFTNGETTYGSHARNLRYYEYQEDFAFYTFNIPMHDTRINKKVEEYGHYNDYIQHNYVYNKNMNYYSYVYGSDRGEITFDFHQPKKENLLLLSNSFSNPVNVLIAQHFDKTYVVDLRYYKKQIGEEFKISDYIKNNKIDKVLFIMSPTFVTKNDSNQGLEK